LIFLLVERTSATSARIQTERSRRKLLTNVTSQSLYAKFVGFLSADVNRRAIRRILEYNIYLLQRKTTNIGGDDISEDVERIQIANRDSNKFISIVIIQPWPQSYIHEEEYFLQF